ncbi:hypothetical protein [Psychromicrobium lacuslunae]|uniref:Peptidase S1 domain-containing protein n=1 Tax=Psychromicrobium lacuslunae TaxID=1618207 RepID=A0A0D4C0U7_9MICC|nr:hypothetical protein [Psychromicrobium lacuslunae]AJT42174.1 hypothetical protein UM93_12885 [Psychromicrobium lacuslunae]
MKAVFSKRSALALLASFGVIGAIMTPAATAATDHNHSSAAVPLSVQQTMAGEPSAELSALCNQINDFLAKHPAVFSGSYLSADSRLVNIGVATQEDPAVKELKALLAKIDPRSKFTRLTVAKNSMTQLEEARSAIVRDYLGKAGSSVKSVGIDASQDSVVVGVVPQSEAFAAKDVPAASTISASFGDRVVFSKQTNQGLAASSRYDTSPHYGGAGYQWYNASGSAISQAICSLSFPIKIGTITYGLTAGHCRQGTQSNYLNAYSEGGGVSAAYSFGHHETTTWVGTQDTYGDFSLLAGSNYQSRVYNGPIGSESSVDVVGASWNFPSIGAGMCTSGRTSGQVCRYKVLQTNFCATYGIAGQPQYPNCELFMMGSDQNLDGAYDCNGFIPGDSGGAVYSAAPGGGVTGYGIVSAILGNCQYVATSLHGVRKWSPTATMP